MFIKVGCRIQITEAGPTSFRRSWVGKSEGNRERELVGGQHAGLPVTSRCSRRRCKIKSTRLCEQSLKCGFEKEQLWQGSTPTHHTSTEDQVQGLPDIDASGCFKGGGLAVR